MQAETTTLPSPLAQQRLLRYDHKKFILIESDCQTDFLNELPEHCFHFYLLTSDVTKNRSLEMMSPFQQCYHFEIPEKTKVSCLAIDPDFLYALVGDHRERLIEYFNTSHEQHPTFQRQLWVLHTLFHNALRPEMNPPLNRIYIESKIIEIIARITFLTEDRSLNQQAKDPLFDSIKDFLDNHLMNEHSLSSLAKKFGVNEFKLKKGFKEAHGMPVFKYLQEKRMEYANQLLKEQHLYVGEVASRIGYKNANHFSTAFKKKFGFSPGVLKIA